MSGYWVSRKGYRRLAERVADLERQLNDTKKAMAVSFASDNDIRENPEYMNLRNKVQYLLPKQLAEARRNLSMCRIFEEHRALNELHPTKVRLGSRVEAQADDGATRTFLLLGFEEGGSEPFAVSYLSPIGRALLGAEVGDTVTIDVEGRRRELTVLKITQEL